jgi:hypothetical protein
MHRAKHRARALDLDPLYARANENACKFALLYATSMGPDADMTVTRETAEWAIAVSRAVTEQMVSIARDHIADTPFARNLAAFRDVIKKAGLRGITTKELHKIKKCQLPTKEWEGVISFLCDAGEVVYIDVNAGKLKSNAVAVRARNAYLWAADHLDDDDDD